MTRGEILIAVISGDYGKGRPAVVVQSAHLMDTESWLVCPLSSRVDTAGLFRPRIDPSPDNGLTAPSVIMTEKLTAIPRFKLRSRIGALTAEQLAELDDALMFVLGLD
jgi:mRNA interferase MazF